MPLRSDLKNWGSITKGLHWLIALAVIGLLCVGPWMVELPISANKVRVYALHKSTGVTVLALMCLRMAWRLIEGRRPRLPPGMPAWQRGLANASHGLLYLALLVMPLSGWIFNSAANFPLQWFGLVSMPALAAPDPSIKQLARDVHGWTAWLLIGLVTLHVLAALKHHFFDRDPTLRRMLPGGNVRR